jgi:lipoprotein NlpI
VTHLKEDIVFPRQYLRQDGEARAVKSGGGWRQTMIPKLRIDTFNRTAAAALIGIGLFPPGLAIAQTKQQHEWCVNRGDIYSMDQQITGCTAEIQSGRESRQNFGTSYYNRGIAYAKIKDYDHAIADYNQAIRLNPKPEIYNNRGLTYAWKGEDDRAMADYNQAIQLDPKNAVAYSNRGLIYALRGEYDRAIHDYTHVIQLDPKSADAYENRGWTYLLEDATPKALADLTQANALSPKDAYKALGLEIALKRSDLPSRLSQTATAIDMTKWPAPIIRLYLGQLTPEAVLAAADDPNAKTKISQVCEANFFSGELAVQRGAKDDAIRLFQLAASDCPKDEDKAQVGANAELQKLGMGP